LLKKRIQPIKGDTKAKNFCLEELEGKKSVQEFIEEKQYTFSVLSDSKCRIPGLSRLSFQFPFRKVKFILTNFIKNLKLKIKVLQGNYEIINPK
jgi:hypothetical protein